MSFDQQLAEIEQAVLEKSLPVAVGVIRAARILSAQLTQVSEQFVSSEPAEPVEPKDQQSSCETARAYLSAALDACCDEDEGRLKSHQPRLLLLSPWGARVLLEYEILRVDELPVPVVDPELHRRDRTKPVRQMFIATVQVAVCDRPNYPTTLAAIRQSPSGRTDDFVGFVCKQFMDGDWIFMDEELTK